jgi:hypothetical protein
MVGDGDLAQALMLLIFVHKNCCFVEDEADISQCPTRRLLSMTADWLLCLDTSILSSPPVPLAQIKVEFGSVLGRSG